MGTLRDAKLFGGIGSILMLFVPIVGQVLVIIAAKYISDATEDESIFQNVLYAMIFTIVGGIVGATVYTAPFSQL